MKTWFPKFSFKISTCTAYTLTRLEQQMEQQSQRDLEMEAEKNAQANKRAAAASAAAAEKTSRVGRVVASLPGLLSIEPCFDDCKITW
jgi:hypothetical protein